MSTLNEETSVFRVAIKDFIGDKTGEGSRTSGGRWNQKGSSIIYASQNISLAVLESTIPIAQKFQKDSLYYVEIVLPKRIQYNEIKLSQLSKNWRVYGYSRECVQLGEKWLKEAKTAILKVPSFVLQEEGNYLLNPNHDDFKKIKFLKEKILDLKPKRDE